MLENTKGAIKNEQSREYRKGNQKWTIQRIPKGQSKMNNPENIEGAIKNEQSREYRKGNKKWTIQRILKGQSKMDNPEKLATYGTQEEEKKKKNNVNNTWSLPQTIEVKTTWTSSMFITDLSTWCKWH